MKTFKDFLLESNLTIDDAKTILGLSGDIEDEAQLKTAFKRASIKNHPDKGGTAESMQMVNAAYNILKKVVGKHKSSKIDWDEVEKRNAENGKAWVSFITEQFNSHFDLTAYKQYLEEVSGMPLTQKHAIKSDPRVSNYARVVIEWVSKDRKVIYTIDLAFRNELKPGLSDMSQGLKIGSVSYTTDVLINRSKVKMKQSNYNWGAKTANIFKDPKSAFPSAKIKKAFNDVNKPVKRADYMNSFKNELQAKMSGDKIRLPLAAKSEDGYETYLFLERSTWMRKGQYSINGIYKEINGARVVGYLNGFMESADKEVLDTIIDGLKVIVKKKSIKAVETAITKLVNQVRKMNGLDV